MDNINYKTYTIQALYKLAAKYPEYTTGQLFHTFLRGKNLMSATDEQIYQSIESCIKEEDDAVMTDEDFEAWKENFLKNQN